MKWEKTHKTPWWEKGVENVVEFHILGTFCMNAKLVEQRLSNQKLNTSDVSLHGIAPAFAMPSFWSTAAIKLNGRIAGIKEAGNGQKNAQLGD